MHGCTSGPCDKGGGAGLRALNKSRTRLAIASAAWALFAERGYDEVTLAEVAERAEVGLRTVYRYFPHKELLLDGDEPGVQEAVDAALAGQPEGAPLSALVRAASRAAVGARALDHSRELLRARLAAETPALAARELSRSTAQADLIASRLAHRLGTRPDDFRPAVLAEAVIGAIRAARRRWLADPGLDPVALVDEAVRLIAPALDAADVRRAAA